jgi:energy-coupling factor transporter ATP-binding protein EcfA2
MEPGTSGPSVRITQVTVSDGSDIPVPENGVVLLVGPNNAGKSQFLRDVMGLAKDPGSYRSKVLRVAQLNKRFEGDFSDWFSKKLPHVSKKGFHMYTWKGGVTFSPSP